MTSRKSKESWPTGPDLELAPNAALELNLKSRGLRKKAGADDQVPALIESEISTKEFRRNWARLIQKIYPVKFPKGNPIEQGKSCRSLIVS